MGIAKFASRISGSQFATSGLSGALTVASGNPVQVCGIHFSGDTANATVFTVTDADDTTLYTVHLLTGGTSYNIQVPALYDNGIKVQSNRTGASVAVFHNSPGN